MRMRFLVLSVLVISGLQALAQKAAGSSCTAYYTLAPINPNVVQMLGNPVVPLAQTGFANDTLRQFRNWSFPDKPTSWSDRPSNEELARTRDQLLQPANASDKEKVQRKTALAVSAPYFVRPLSADQWKPLEPWFAKEAPKRISGACVDHDQAIYVMEVGVIWDGSVVSSSSDATARLLYNRTGLQRGENSSMGQNAETVSGGYENRPDEFSGLGSSSSETVTGAYTCVYLYRTDGGTLGKGGVRHPTPDLYYCKANSIMPKTAITTLLKAAAKK